MHQLPEIEAGGAFRGLVRRLPPIELTTNHRQRDPDEQARLRELRHGDVSRAVHAYSEAGLMCSLPSSEETRQQCAADFVDAYLRAANAGHDRTGVAMIALTNQDVVDLNQRARSLLVDAGLVGGPALSFTDGREFATGDYVVTRHTDRKLGIANGDRWTVEHVDTGTGAVRLEPATGGEGRPAVSLPAEYVVQHLRHAYAVTTSIAQGSTLDKAHVLGSEMTYREAGYVAASRARQQTSWYVVSTDHQGTSCVDHPGAPATSEHRSPQATLDNLIRSLSESRAEDLARDQGLSRDHRAFDYESCDSGVRSSYP